MKNTSHKRLRNLIVFAMLGALLLIGKIVFEPLPNVHPLAALVIIYTVVYRSKAIIPIYVYVVLQGLISGFNLWWLPYTYIWTVLWGMTMLLPKKIPVKIAVFVYPLLCALHGLMFGILYAPAQALIFNLDINGMVKWIIAGFPFDIMHAIGNFAAGFLILPITKVLQKLEGDNL